MDLGEGLELLKEEEAEEAGEKMDLVGSRKTNELV